MPSCSNAANTTIPATANTIWAASCIVVATAIAAAASSIATPRCASCRAIVNRAAELSGRQQAVDRLADPARDHRRPRTIGSLGRQQHADRERVDRERQQVERDDQREPPAGRGEHGRHGPEALPREQQDEQRRPDGQQGDGRAVHAPERPRSSCRKPK